MNQFLQRQLAYARTKLFSLLCAMVVAAGVGCNAPTAGGGAPIANASASPTPPDAVTSPQPKRAAHVIFQPVRVQHGFYWIGLDVYAQRVRSEGKEQLKAILVFQSSARPSSHPANEDMYLDYPNGHYPPMKHVNGLQAFGALFGTVHVYNRYNLAPHELTLLIGFLDQAVSSRNRASATSKIKVGNLHLTSSQGKVQWYSRRVKPAHYGYLNRRIPAKDESKWLAVDPIRLRVAFAHTLRRLGQGSPTPPPQVKSALAKMDKVSVRPSRIVAPAKKAIQTETKVDEILLSNQGKFTRLFLGEKVLTIPGKYKDFAAALGKPSRLATDPESFLAVAIWDREGLCLHYHKARGQVVRLAIALTRPNSPWWPATMFRGGIGLDGFAITTHDLQRTSDRWQLAPDVVKKLNQDYAANPREPGDIRAFLAGAQVWYSPRTGRLSGLIFGENWHAPGIALYD